MKILTKKWAERHEQVRLAHRLKEFNSNKTTYYDIKVKSKNDFYDEIAKDVELAKVCRKTNIADKLYQARIERDRKTILSLPKEVYNKIKDFKSVVLGYANKEDKELLTSYAKKILKVVEKEAEEANRLTEIAQDCLPEEFILDEVVGELVYEEYSNGKHYFIRIGGFEVCVEDYQIIEREDFKINEWEENNPLSLWTTLVAGELHYISNKCYELRLLLIDGDEYANETYWYFSLRGTNVKFVKE